MVLIWCAPGCVGVFSYGAAAINAAGEVLHQVFALRSRAEVVRLIRAGKPRGSANVPLPLRTLSADTVPGVASPAARGMGVGDLWRDPDDRVNSREMNGRVLRGGCQTSDDVRCP